MKNVKKIFSFVFIIVATMVLTAPSHVFAATIGNVLSEPEDGWERYDDSDARIQYTGIWDKAAVSNAYKGYYAYTLKPSSSISFKFYGTKLRIIANVRSSNRPNIVNINIDGTSEAFSESTNKGGNIEQVLVYEKKDLTLGNHTVTITSSQPSSSIALTLDAIEIDNTGYLIDQNQTINLNAQPGDSQVVLSWESTNGASGYNVKRSKVIGGPYEVLSLTTSHSGSIITCIDTGLTNGTTYYYVVSAIVSGKEIPDSNEVSATPTEAQKSKLKVVLEVSEKLQLSVDDDLNENTEMTWTSSDASVAAVDGNGVVTALKPGNTVITCVSEDGEYTDTINVLVVENAKDYRLAVDLKVGKSCRLTVDDLTDTVNVTWDSMDTSVATVSSNGKVTAVGKGLTIITATDDEGSIIGQVYVRVRN